MGTVKEVVISEMDHVMEMAKMAVDRIKGDFWKMDENDWTYGYVLFHAIETIEFYMSDSEEDWVPLSDVSQNSREKETETLKHKDRVFFKQYLGRVETKTYEILNSMTEAQYLEKDGFSPRGFKSRLHKYSYTLRHTMYHLGELTKHLRSLDMERIKW